jgi:hypothetical protein
MVADFVLVGGAVTGSELKDMGSFIFWILFHVSSRPNQNINTKSDDATLINKQSLAHRTCQDNKALFDITTSSEGRVETCASFPHSLSLYR